MTHRWSTRWMLYATCAIAPCMTATAAAAQQIAVVEQPGAVDTGVLTRPVTIKLQNVSLRAAVIAVGNAAHVRLVYQKEQLDAAQRSVSIRVTNVPLGKAFEIVLNGTPLTAVSVQHDIVSIEAAVGAERKVNGGITGVITDASTHRPIVGAVVQLQGTTHATRTDEHGQYHFTDVRAGTYRLVARHLGYQVATAQVTVHDDAIQTVSLALSTATAKLDEVVTTALGAQRRLEVGNVISHLNVDSISRTAPVASITDLLSGRAPGVQVIQGDGMAGSSAAIRIRGTSSLVLQGDPIVIVDGVRQDNSPGGAQWNGLTNTISSSSRLNDIDYSQVESIDILKGPAAATEYGTDAANGVIVITTKRGKPGRTRWRTWGEHAWDDVPYNFPDFYYAWGHLTDSTRAPVHCELVPQYQGLPSLSDGTCKIDSVTHDNPLNHPEYTNQRTGLHDRANIEVSGGSELVQYFVGGGTSHDIGSTQIPKIFDAQAAAYGFPKSALDANTLGQNSVRANLSAALTKALQMSANVAYMITNQVAPNGGSALPNQQGEAVVFDSAHNYGYGEYGSYSPLATLGTTTDEKTTRATGGLVLDWHPTAWLAGHVSSGLDHGLQDQNVEVNPIAWFIGSGNANAGGLYVSTTNTDITSLDARASLTLPLSNALRSVTSFGLQSTNTRSKTLTGETFGSLTPGNMTLNGAPYVAVTQNSDGHATLGGYGEEMVAIRDQLFLTGAIRFDGASGFGNDYHVTAYPKLSASWLAYNTGATSVRLRTGFGAAGAQPTNGAALQLYTSQSVYASGTLISGSKLSGPGNPDLRPERSQEWEGGVDLSFLDSRVNIEYTHYSKHTKDALITVPLGFTLGNLSVQENLGDVQNSGDEAQLQLSVIRNQQTTWDLTLNASANHNKLLTLAPGFTNQNAGDYQRQAVGYPLYGYWVPTVTWDDGDHNGILTRSEITVSDSPHYAGTSLPKIETSLSSQLGLFRGKIKVGAMFDYRSGGVVLNNEISPWEGTLREQNDSTAPLWEQARVLGYLTHSGPTALNLEQGWFVRFRELSFSYALPEQWSRLARASSLNLTAAVRNVALWTHYSGVDPEVSAPGSQYLGNGQYATNNDVRIDSGNGVPLPRSWTIRLDVGF